MQAPFRQRNKGAIRLFKESFLPLKFTKSKIGRRMVSTPLLQLLKQLHDDFRAGGEKLNPPAGCCGGLRSLGELRRRSSHQHAYESSRRKCGDGIAWSP